LQQLKAIIAGTILDKIILCYSPKNGR